MCGFAGDSGSLVPLLMIAAYCPSGCTPRQHKQYSKLHNKGQGVPDHRVLHVGGALHPQPGEGGQGAAKGAAKGAGKLSLNSDMATHFLLHPGPERGGKDRAQLHWQC